MAGQTHRTVKAQSLPRTEYVATAMLLWHYCLQHHMVRLSEGGIGGNKTAGPQVPSAVAISRSSRYVLEFCKLRGSRAVKPYRVCVSSAWRTPSSSQMPSLWRPTHHHPHALWASHTATHAPAPAHTHPPTPTVAHTRRPACGAEISQPTLTAQACPRAAQPLRGASRPRASLRPPRRPRCSPCA